MYGHQKFKTGAIRSYGNVIAYASEFGGKWKTPGTIADEPNAMFDNKVWFVDNAQCEYPCNAYNLVLWLQPLAVISRRTEH